MVRVALISIEKEVLMMLEREASSRGYEIVYKEFVPPSILERAVNDALECNIDIIIACCQKPVRNVYKGVAVNVIYVQYDTAELVQNLQTACREINCLPKNAAFVVYDALLSDETNFEGEKLPVLYKADGALDTSDTVRRAILDHAQVVFGGTEVCKCASNLGIPNVVFTFGDDDVKRAFEQAEVLRESITAEKRHRIELDTALRGAACGMIVVNQRGIVTAINEHAIHLFDCAGKTVTGMYVLNLFQELEKETLNQVLLDGEQVYNHIVGSRKKRYSVSIEPAIEDEKVISAVLSVQRSAVAPPASAHDTASQPNRAEPLYSFSSFKYVSEVFRGLLKNAKFASYTDVPILLVGEEGTEMLELAQSIHRESTRAEKPFFEVECNAWSQQHIDELLFGSSEKADRKCLVQEAEGGTIFFNHIDELAKETQFKVYKLITGFYASIGDLRMIPSDIRIVAATGKNLRDMISAGTFREDLYYNLSVITLSVPPLRARKEDITCMVNAWMTYFSELYSKPVFLKRAVYDCISEYRWPGNARQLKHLCQKIVLTTPHRNISEAFVRNEIEKLMRESNDAAVPQIPERHKSEAAMIIAALEENRGNKTKAAQQLGISKTTLWRKIQKYGITEFYH